MLNMNQKHKHNQDFFETIDTEEKSYWLGFLAADGCLSSRENGNRTVNLTQGKKDVSHLLRFKTILNATQKLYERTNKTYGSVTFRLSISSQKMFSDLVDKGLTPRKSLTLKPPKNVPQELIRHWIRGYFDGDGSIHIYFDKRFKHRNNPLKFRGSFAGTQEVLTFIKEKINISGSVRKPKNVNIFYLRFSGKYQIEKVYHYLYNESTLFLNRKKNIFDERKIF